MSQKFTVFSAYTTAKMDAVTTALPLPDEAKGDLTALLTQDGDYIFLTLRSDTNMETVKAYMADGSLLIERGIEGTTAAAHHYGTCVSSVNPTIIAAVKDLICNYECCEGDCPCQAIEVQSADLPSAYVNRAWAGHVTFAGSTPMNLFASAGIPAWMTARQAKNIMYLSGTPTAAGTINFDVYGVNCSGNHTASRHISLTVGN